MPTWQYDPALVRVFVVAPPVVLEIADGFAPGTFVTMSRDAPRWRKHVGLEGQVARTKSYRSGRVSLSLEAGSRFNAALTGLHLADDLLGLGIAGIVIRDKNVGAPNITQPTIAGVNVMPELGGGAPLGIATRAWIIGEPDLQRGSEAGAIDWLWDCDDVEILHAGLDAIDGNLRIAIPGGLPTLGGG